jgi:HEAT repeat protein
VAKQRGKLAAHARLRGNRGLLAMSPSVQAALLAAIGLAAVVVGLFVLLPRWGERRRRLRALATLLRGADAQVRVDTLERVRGLGAGDRALLGRMLRKGLAAGARGGAGPAQPGQAVTVWFVRQILNLLGDPRTPVRMDAARVLRRVLRTEQAGAGEEKEEAAAVTPAVMAAVELAGGRVVGRGEEWGQETRFLAFAEMLEAGLRPLAAGMPVAGGLEAVSAEAMETMASALRDRSPRVRRSLCEVLAAMGGERATEMLVSLLQDPSPELRARAAQALGSLKAGSATSQVAALLRDPVGEVRGAAASALVEIGLTGSCGPVVEALVEECRREDGDEAARAAMIEAVARLVDGAREDLARAWGVLPRPVAARLAEALEQQGVIERWLGEGEWKDKDEVFSDLLARGAELGVSRPFLEALDSAEERVRLRAAAALGHSSSGATRAALAGLLGDPDGPVRTQAVKSLAELGEALALGPLSQAAADPDPEVRLAALRGLRRVLAGRGNWRSEGLPGHFDLRVAVAESQRALLAAAGDEQDVVRAEAARAEAAHALGLLGTPESVEALVGLALGAGSEATRRAAREALSRQGFAQSRRLLAAALEDRDEERRARAVEVMGALGGREGARQVLEALHDSASRVREMAIAALAGIEVEGSPAATGLIGELRNPDARVRAAAARHLGRARSAECAEGLVQALGDPEEEVRVSALEALGALGRLVRKHQGALTARLGDPSPRVREAAAAALNSLRGTWAEGGDVAELFRQGSLSAAGAAALVDIAADGDLEPLLWALDNPKSADSLAAFLSGPGRGKLGALLTCLREAQERDRTRVVRALAQAARRGNDTEAYLGELKAISPGVRLVGVEMAGMLGTAAAVEALIEVLEHDPVAEVRSRSASALGEASFDSPALGGQAQVMLREEVRAALLRAQGDDPNEIVRLVAERALDRGRAFAERGPVIPAEG